MTFIAEMSFISETNLNNLNNLSHKLKNNYSNQWIKLFILFKFVSRLFRSGSVRRRG